MGTYVTDVPTFVYAYMQQKKLNQQDLGNDDYVTPDEIQYTECTRRVVDNVEYFVQLGCSDYSTLALSLNVYKDNICSESDTVSGSDDANADISALQVGILVSSRFHSIWRLTSCNNNNNRFHLRNVKLV
jgi:hypothetical protein